MHKFRSRCSTRVLGVVALCEQYIYDVYRFFEVRRQIREQPVRDDVSCVKL